MSNTVRFNNAPGLARFITLPVSPVSTNTAAAMVHVLAGYRDTAAHEEALNRLAAELFPRRTWRERLVKPRERLGALEPDLQLELVRRLCSQGVPNGLG